MKKLPRQFFLRSALEVAPNLLGKILVRKTPEGIASGRIVEVEAYMGDQDAASHSFGGLRSPRTEILYGPGGHAYVYLIYGLHHCLNVVSNRQGLSQGVMIRALEPLEGIDLMCRRRATDKQKNLCSGPGKLCAALAIGKECYGADLCGGELYLLDDGVTLEPGMIAAGRRIGIDYAGEAKDYPWRFIVKDSPFISAGLK